MFPRVVMMMLSHYSSMGNQQSVLRPQHCAILHGIHNTYWYASALTSGTRFLLRQGGLRPKFLRDDSPDWVAFCRGADLPGSRDFNLLEMLRDAFVPAPFLVWCRHRFGAVSRYTHL